MCFNVLVEYNYTPSGHGKGQADAVGAAVKRSLTNESSRRGEKNPIRSVEDCHFHLEENSEKIIPILVEAQEILETKAELESRYKFAQKVTGCRKDLHVFRSMDGNKTELKVACTSFSKNEMTVRVSNCDDYT